MLKKRPELSPFLKFFFEFVPELFLRIETSYSHEKMLTDEKQSLKDQFVCRKKEETI